MRTESCATGKCILLIAHLKTLRQLPRLANGRDVSNEKFINHFKKFVWFSDVVLNVIQIRYITKYVKYEGIGNVFHVWSIASRSESRMWFHVIDILRKQCIISISSRGTEFEIISKPHEICIYLRQFSECSGARKILSLIISDTK